MGVDRMAGTYLLDEVNMETVDPKYVAWEKERKKRKRAALVEFNREARMRAKYNAERWEKKK
jgi:hypothetical protein